MGTIDLAGILQQSDHRPYATLDTRWTMFQSWHDLLFAHWPIPVADLMHLVPACLEIDRFDGAAWVGVVPFRMTDVRLRITPAIPWLSRFPELNVRTYVRAAGKPGVYFFSLDAASRPAVAAARAWYHLPYFYAKMRCDIQHDGSVNYFSQRRDSRGRPGELIASYRPTSGVALSEAGSIESWLTERYCLYTTDIKGALYCGEIHHRQWPLQAAEARFEKNTMLEAAGIEPPNTSPLLHFSKRLDVLIWPLSQCECEIK